MKTKRCLYCYMPLTGDDDFHEKCSKIFFGTVIPPSLDYDNKQMSELAKEIVIRSITVTGVQPKLSLTIEKTPGDPKNSRLTIVGLWGNYILKPPSDELQHLPENEDVTMHLSQLLHIPTASHSLIRLRSGELAYITKRFDRVKANKLALEDMCQLAGKLTEDKYRGSMELVGRSISAFSTRKGLDLVTFFEQSLFCFLTGNADMHLKNFSLLRTADKEIILSPAYDILSTRIALPEDQEEMALTVNGRKNRIKKTDFDALAQNLKIPQKTIENSYAKIAANIKTMKEWIEISFLPKKLKEEYKSLITSNAKRLGLA